MKNINKLIVPLFAMEGPDLSVKAAKLRNNIRHGKDCLLYTSDAADD